MQLKQQQKELEYRSDRIKKLEEDLVYASIKIESDKTYLKNQEERIDRLKSQVANTQEPPEYTIEMPEIDVEEIKKALKLADSFTMETIVQYLKLDNYELVKNLAKITNKENVSETIAYRDGAIGRNEALIKVLSEAIKSKTFINRVKGEVDSTKKL